MAKVTGGGDGERGEDAARWVALRGKGANGRAGVLIETWERALGSEGKAVGEREMGEERAARATRTPPKTNGSKSNETRNGATRDASDDEATLPAFWLNFFMVVISRQLHRIIFALEPDLPLLHIL